MAPARDENDAPASPAESATVGLLLRRLRENRGLTQEAVSLETRIPVASIRRIEENRFAELPGEVFVRGFLRAYARAVGADPVRVMTVYDEQRGPAEPLKASRWPGLFRIQRPRRFGFFVAVLVFLAVLGLLLAFVLRGVGEDDATAGAQRTPAQNGVGDGADRRDAS